jgi:glycosyltransferase involved in cell wall biosynthesis
MSKSQILRFGLCSIIDKTPHDIIYFNSFFSFLFTGHILLFLKFLKFKNNPIIIAARGEFSQGALSIKPVKKYIYIKLFKLFQICKKVLWHASSEFEKDDILKSKFGNDNNIFIAQNLTNSNVEKNYFKNKIENTNCLQIVFIARISRVKNLDFLLKVLKKTKSKIYLDIYGPKEDISYYEYCLDLVDELPLNVKVKFKGTLPSDKVKNTFKKYDLFVFPTKGENFGHVIIESLSSGTCVLISDKTPWKESESIKVLKLCNKDFWVLEIEKWAKFSNKDLVKKRKAANVYSDKFLNNPKSFNQNLELFNSVLNK